MSNVGSSQFGALLIDGYSLLSSNVQTFRWKIKTALQRTDGLGDLWDEYSPTGKRSAEVAQDGAFFDTNANRIHDAFKTAPVSTTRLMGFAPAGNLIGALFVGVQGIASILYEVIAQGSGLVKANAGYQVNGKVDEGVIVQQHDTKSIDWNTRTDGFTIDYTSWPYQTVIPITSNTVANPTVVTTPVPHGLSTGHIILISGVSGGTPSINGERQVTVISATTFSIPVNASAGGTGGSFVRANSLSGAVGYQFISHLSGFTGFVGKIRDSPDNSVFSDLITFVDADTGPQAQRIEVAGTIDRYLSFDGNVTGSGLINIFAGLRRL